MVTNSGAAVKVGELRRIHQKVRADGGASGPGHMSRRLVPVTGTSPSSDVAVGDIAVLDRRVLGRRSLLRLADELALRGPRV